MSNRRAGGRLLPALLSVVPVCFAGCGRHPQPPNSARWDTAPVADAWRAYEPSQMRPDASPNDLVRAISQTTAVSVPQQWIELLQSTIWAGDDSVRYVLWDIERPELLLTVTHDSQRQVWANGLAAGPVRLEDEWRFRGSVVLVEHLGERYLVPEMWPPGACSVYRLKPEGGGAEVIAHLEVEGGPDGYSGPGGEHRVFPVCTNQEMVIFGISDCFWYIEAIDLATGEKLWSFGSDVRP